MTRRALGPLPAPNSSPRRRFPVRVESLEDRRLLATFTVTRADDGGVIEGTMTLRQAIDAANQNTAVDLACSPFPGPGIMGVRGAGVHQAVARTGSHQ